MAPPTFKELLTAFSPVGDYLALSAGDGRVKVWDTVNGSLRGEFSDIAAITGGANLAAGEVDGHLAVDYTCMAWNPTIKKGKKRSGKHGSALLALGTGGGDVLMWDATLGEIKWKIKDCHAGGVRSLAFAKSGSVLYSAGADGMVCEYDISSGQLLGKFRSSKRAVSCIAVSSDGSSLVAGSSELKLFDLSSKKRSHKFMGHPDAVKAIIYTENGNYIFSAAAGERHVAVWRCDGNQSEGVAACVLSMEHPAVSLDCSGEIPGTLRVLAVSEAGIAYVWCASSVEELAKVKPSKISVESLKGGASVSGKSGKSLRPGVFAARFSVKDDRNLGPVLVAYGTAVKPNFEHVLLKDEGGSIILHGYPNGVLLPPPKMGGAVGAKISHDEAMVLGPDNAADAIQPRPHVESAEPLASTKLSSKKKRRASRDLGEDSQPIDVDRPKTTGTEESESDGVAVMPVHGNDEETMEEKLRALGLLESGGDEETGGKNDSVVPPKADSIQVLLTQALQADDNALLEQCLSVSDEKVITNTIRRLRSSDAAKFLEISVFKMEARPRRGLSLVPWIRALLLHHAAYIMSNPSLQSVLNSLYQVIDARLSVFRSLLSLSGRLDLITAQMSNKWDRIADEAEPAVIYEEESDEESEGKVEVEDVMEEDMNRRDIDDSGTDDVEGNEQDGSRINLKNDALNYARSDETDDEDEDDL